MTWTDFNFLGHSPITNLEVDARLARARLLQIKFFGGLLNGSPKPLSLGCTADIHSAPAALRYNSSKELP